MLFPEGMIRVQGTGQNILELCDGQRHGSGDRDCAFGDIQRGGSSKDSGRRRQFSGSSAAEAHCRLLGVLWQRRPLAGAPKIRGTQIIQ